MHPRYQDALLANAAAAISQLDLGERLDTAAVRRTGTTFFVPFHTASPADRYLARIDADRFPVEPYEVGFIDPETAESDWLTVSSRDPRFWPWSPMPGLHGSFHISYARAIRVFWCRPCTASYFYFHGADADSRWEPNRWPAAAVVAALVNAASLAVHPRHWRATQRPTLLMAAQSLGVELPPDAGIDDR